MGIPKDELESINKYRAMTSQTIHSDKIRTEFWQTMTGLVLEYDLYTFDPNIKEMERELMKAYDASKAQLRTLIEEIIGEDNGPDYPGGVIAIETNSQNQLRASQRAKLKEMMGEYRMSRANAQIKFPDGTIKYGIYNGTIDHYWFPLFDTSEQAWGAWEEYYSSKPMDDSKWERPHDDGYYTVDIADDYGSGDTYIGRASKSQIVSDTDTDKMVRIGEGLPKWWVK